MVVLCVVFCSGLVCYGVCWFLLVCLVWCVCLCECVVVVCVCGVLLSLMLFDVRCVCCVYCVWCNVVVCICVCVF